MNLLSDNGRTWRKVEDILRRKEAIGRTLRLMCKKHPDTRIEIQKPEDFSKGVSRFAFCCCS